MELNGNKRKVLIYPKLEIMIEKRNTKSPYVNVNIDCVEFNSIQCVIMCCPSSFGCMMWMNQPISIVFNILRFSFPVYSHRLVSFQSKMKPTDFGKKNIEWWKINYYFARKMLHEKWCARVFRRPSASSPHPTYHHKIYLLINDNVHCTRIDYACSYTVHIRVGRFSNRIMFMETPKDTWA